MKKINYSILLAFASLAGLVSCQKNASIINGVDEHEQISFSMGDGTGTKAGFAAPTKIVMRIQSDERVSTSPRVLYTRTKATAAVTTDASATGYSTVTIGDPRYWDDAFGRYGQLSVYAVAVDQKNSDSVLPDDVLKAGSSTAPYWGSEANNKMTWTVLPVQTADEIANKDLVYSNNIKDGGTDGVYRWNYTSGKYLPEDTGATTHTAGRMLFFQNGVELAAEPTAAPGHFDKGHLVFNHALSRITVTLVPGTGFTETSEFKFTQGTNIQLDNMNLSGTFDVSTGAWSSPTTGNITAMVKTETPSGAKPAAGTYMAQMLPGFIFASAGTNVNVMEFTIDNNKYYITNAMLNKALSDNAPSNGLTADQAEYEMLMGKNYTFKITVNKTGINSITATVAPWQNVIAADQGIENSYVHITTGMQNPTYGEKCNNFDLYRMKVESSDILTDQTSSTADSFVNYAWGGDYKEKATLTETSAGSGVWKTNWYFESNKAFYHFRTVNKNTPVVLKDGDTDVDDYFVITSGAVASTDPHWGAPMKTSATLYEYDVTHGYAGSSYTAENGGNIFKAIGSTKDAIHIQEFHMMSKINIVLKTVAEDEGGVKLKDGENVSVVSLTQFVENGQVKMGNGLVTPTGALKASQNITAPDTYFKTGTIETNPYNWCVVPQPIKRTSGEHPTIGVTIKTPDNNFYYITDLSTIQVNGTTTPITRWLPNHDYTYTFVIKKTGIQNITCTVAAWQPVVAADKNVGLED